MRMFKKLRLLWDESRTKRLYLKEIKEARDRKDQDKIQEIEGRYWWDMQEIDQCKFYWQQEKLIAAARRLYIPVPPKNTEKIRKEYQDDNWFYATPISEFLLKEQALVTLRREVRREQKEKLDLWMPWLSPIIGLIIGIITTIFTLWFGRFFR